MSQRSMSNKITKQALQRNRDAFAFLAPAMLVIFIFLVLPACNLFYMSFRSTNYAGRPDIFVGWENYKNLFDDLIFTRSISSTLIFSAIGLPIQLGLALFLAIQVNKKNPFTTFFRTVYFIPVVISFVVVSLLWKYMYNKDMGLINALLSWLGLPKQGFLSDANQALSSIIATYTWKTFGFYMMIYVSGLQSIPEELYESAAIDGVNGWQKFAYITFPLLKSTTLFVIVIGSINIIVKSFIPTFVMTEGGPRSVTTMLVYFIWRNAFRLMEIGYASAAAVILFLIVMVITILQLVIGDRENT